MNRRPAYDLHNRAGPMEHTYQGGLAGFWTPRRQRLYPMAVLIGLVLGFSIFVLTTQGLTSVLGGRMGGDFPAFYAAGRLAASPHPERLYDPAAQQDAQRDLIPGAPNGWIPFAYPPHVATLYGRWPRFPAARLTSCTRCSWPPSASQPFACC